MITRERLQELIEQDAIIYIIKAEPFIAGYVNELKIVPIALNNCYGISTEKYNKKYNCKPQFYRNAFVCETICDADKVFETKEEAEWYLKFGNITRTETLSLPSWEELKQKISSNGYGNKTIVNFDNYIFEYKRTKTQVVLGINLGCETLFYGELTLANYTDACELAKKLFLGQEKSTDTR